MLRYDKKNHATFVGDSLGNTTQYYMNRAGIVTKLVNAAGAEIQYKYDPISFKRTSRVDGLGNKTLWTYNARGNLTTIVHPGGAVVNIEYDDQNHRLEPSTPRADSGSVSTTTPAR